MSAQSNNQASAGIVSDVIDWLWRTKGTGLNSIPIRFALMSLVMTTLSLWAAQLQDSRFRV